MTALPATLVKFMHKPYTANDGKCVFHHLEQLLVADSTVKTQFEGMTTYRVAKILCDDNAPLWAKPTLGEVVYLRNDADLVDSAYLRNTVPSDNL